MCTLYCTALSYADSNGERLKLEPSMLGELLNLRKLFCKVTSTTNHSSAASRKFPLGRSRPHIGQNRQMPTKPRPSSEAARWICYFAFARLPLEPPSGGNIAEFDRLVALPAPKRSIMDSVEPRVRAPSVAEPRRLLVLESLVAASAS